MATVVDLVGEESRFQEEPKQAPNRSSRGRVDGEVRQDKSYLWLSKQQRESRRRAEVLKDVHRYDRFKTIHLLPCFRIIAPLRNILPVNFWTQLVLVHYLQMWIPLYLSPYRVLAVEIEKSYIRVLHLIIAVRSGSFLKT